MVWTGARRAVRLACRYSSATWCAARAVTRQPHARALSSAGRASPLQGEGRGFEPLSAHRFSGMFPVRRESEDRDGARLGASCYLRLNLAQDPRDPAACMWIHRQEVDDVGPVLAALVAVTHWRDEIASRSAWSRIRTRRSVSRAGSDAIQDGQPVPNYPREPTRITTTRRRTTSPRTTKRRFEVLNSESVRATGGGVRESTGVPRPSRTPPGSGIGAAGTFGSSGP